MTKKVLVKDTKTGHVHEVFSVDAAEMAAQADGRYVHHHGKVKKGDIVPVGTPAPDKGAKASAAAPSADKPLKRRVGESKADFAARSAAAAPEAEDDPAEG